MTHRPYSLIATSFLTAIAGFAVVAAGVGIR